MVEAPLLIRPYLAGMSRGGLFATMTVGMAGVAGTVLALYAAILGPVRAGRGGAPDRRLRDQRAGGADAVGADGAGRRRAGGRRRQGRLRDIVIEDPPRSSMDAIAQGTREGIDLLVNVTAMLIVVVALVALANQLLGFVTAPLGATLTLRADAGLGVRAAGVADRHPLGRVHGGRRPAGRQDGAERVRRLPAARRPPARACCRSARG